MHQFIIAECLRTMGMSRPTQKFVQEVLATWMTVRGRFNFANLSRYIEDKKRFGKRDVFPILELNHTRAGDTPC
jgi:hypothetical protein